MDDLSEMRVNYLHSSCVFAFQTFLSNYVITGAPLFPISILHMSLQSTLPTPPFFFLTLHDTKFPKKLVSSRAPNFDVHDRFAKQFAIWLDGSAGVYRVFHKFEEEK